MGRVLAQDGELIKHLQLPGQPEPGLRSLLDGVVQAKREDIDVL